MDIKFFALDVDGTLTDGKVNICENGELFKSFDIKDGCGIKDILPKYGITPVIITARNSQALAKRCEELGITELHQGCRNKFDKLNEIVHKADLRYTLANVAYMGDDILDLPPMIAVKRAGGLAVCPYNAVEKVKQESDFICCKNAGEGAVREFIDWLVDFVEESKLFQIKKYSNEAYLFVKSIFDDNKQDGCYHLSDGAIANIITYTTKPVQLTSFETHKKYIDVQYMIYGEELMVVENVSCLMDCIIKEYDEEKDITFYDYNAGSCVTFSAGDVEVLKPEDAHRGAIALNNPIKIRKIVFKVPVNYIDYVGKRPKMTSFKYKIV